MFFFCCFFCHSAECPSAEPHAGGPELKGKLLWPWPLIWSTFCTRHVGGLSSLRCKNTNNTQASKQGGMQLFARRRFTESTNSRISCTNTWPAVRNTVVSVWFPCVWGPRGPQLARRGRTPIDQLAGSKRACQKVLMSAQRTAEAWSSDVNGNQEWMISLKHSGTS